MSKVGSGLGRGWGEVGARSGQGLDIKQGKVKFNVCEISAFKHLHDGLHWPVAQVYHPLASMFKKSLIKLADIPGVKQLGSSSKTNCVPEEQVTVLLPV